LLSASAFAYDVGVSPVQADTIPAAFAIEDDV